MTAREIITRRLNHEGTEITPYEVPIEAGLYQRLTEYYKDENWEAKKLRKFTCRYLSVDTRMSRRINDTYEKDPFGALWRMDKKPWHLETPPLAEPTFVGYDFPKPETFTEDIYKNKPNAIQKYEADNEHYRIIAMGWGIFEGSWNLRGFENTLMDVITDEDYYKEACEKLTELHLAMLRACADVPADAYMFGDDWGDQRGILIGPDRWRKFIKPCWTKIFAEVHHQGKKSLHHSCGSIAEIYDDLIEIGMDCHENVQPEAHGMAPEIVKKRWGKKMSFWGCLGSQSTLHHGSPAEIKNEVKRLHELFKQDGGYVLSPAKPLFDEMDIKKAVALIEALSEMAD